MSAGKTKFPKDVVPARKMHQQTAIVGKNGLPVDALATIEPGSIFIANSNTTISYSAPTVTFDASVDLSSMENFNSNVAEHTGLLLFTDNNNNSYFIDPASVNNTTKTLNIYITAEFSSSPTSVDTSIGWSTSEAELVNRLQTTTTAVVDNIEFRDIEVKVDLDGSTVNIKDDDGDQLEINQDGSTNTNIISTSPDSAEVNGDRELRVRDDDSNTSLSSIDSKLVDGNDIGDVTVNNPVTNPVQTQLGNGTTNISDTGIGPDTLINVKKAEDPTFYTRVDKPDAATTFVGKTYDLDANTSDAVWQITRTIVAGTETITQYAEDENTYDKVWNDRVSLFGAPPFANQSSIQFDGANDFIDVTNNAAIDFDFRTEAASWSIWLKTSDTSGAKTYMEKMDSNVGWRFYLSVNRLTLELRGTGFAGDRIRVRSDNGGTTGTTLNDGLWHHIMATYDGSGNASGVTLYLDGSTLPLDIQNDGLVTDSSNTENMAIGSRTGGGNNFGPGNLDEPSIWDVELGSSEVTTIYNAGVPIDLQGQGVSPISASLVAWWRMGDGPSDVYPNITDVESAIVGTMTNMTAGDIESETP